MEEGQERDVSTVDPGHVIDDDDDDDYSVDTPDSTRPFMYLLTHFQQCVCDPESVCLPMTSQTRTRHLGIVCLFYCHSKSVWSNLIGHVT